MVRRSAWCSSLWASKWRGLEWEGTNLQVRKKRWRAVINISGRERLPGTTAEDEKIRESGLNLLFKLL